jgi:hypothetical protein
MAIPRFANPFRPGAGHMPPYLAGRDDERKEFERLLKQTVILNNLVLTGLRGVGKTVLVDTFKPLAITSGWLWVGTDLSEATSLTEERLATRIITDLAVVTSQVVFDVSEAPRLGFNRRVRVEHRLDFQTLTAALRAIPGLMSDKLKGVLELIWHALRASGSVRGVVFAYDEAQNLADHAAKDEYPLSLLLDVFQSIQKKGIPFMLALAGLPTLFPKLVQSRTFAERMFRVLFLDRLSDKDCRDAIVKPISDARCPVSISDKGIKQIIQASGGYPYFIQFICREMYDAYLQKVRSEKNPAAFIDEITRKLDSDFFAGRWARVSERQRQLLQMVAQLPDHGEEEFTVQEIAAASRKLLKRPLSASQVNQMLVKLTAAGITYKNRHGKYSFAIPLLGRFILRNLAAPEEF